MRKTAVKKTAPEVTEEVESVPVGEEAPEVVSDTPTESVESMTEPIPEEEKTDDIEPDQVAAEEPDKDKAFKEETTESEDLDDTIRKAIEGEDEPVKKKSGHKLIFVALVILILLLIGIGGYFLSGNMSLGGEKEQVVEEVIEATPTPATLERSEIAFEVLNGSGITGAAKEAADKLEALGYYVILVDNADTSDFTENELYIAADMEDKGDLLVKDLKADFNIASVSGILKNSTASARLIIGKD